MYTHSSSTIADLRPGHHLCCLYETEEEHRAVLTPFLRQGLQQGEKVFYIVDAHTSQTVLGYLRDDGLDVEPYLACGQLAIVSHDDAYMREGIFDPEAMIALLRAETERALAEGYPALRVTGEMTWALRGLSGSGRLIEYEARLNEFFPGSRCLAICQYDQRRFDPAVLLDVLRTHPVAVIGTAVYDNFHYIPPAELLGPDLPAAKLRRWVQNLAEHRQAEKVEELELLLSAATAASSTLELDRVLAILAEKMATSVQATFCRIALLDEAKQTLTIQAASPIRGLDWDPGLGRRYALADAPWHRWVIEKGETVVLRQDDSSKAASQTESRLALSEGIQSALLIPLRVGDRVLGVASLGEMRRWQRTPFTADRVRLCQAMADQAAIAIQNAHLHEQVQRHAAKLEERAAQLRESEARYRTLVEQVPAVTYIAALDETSTTLYVSPQIEALLGFSPDEWVADPELWFKQLHPDDRQRVLAEMSRSRANGEPFRCDYRLLARDGRVVWVRDEAMRIGDETGQPLFAQGIMLDITARKGQELAISEERSRIARDIHDGIIQELASLGLGLDFCIKEMEHNPTGVRQELTKIRELLRHNIRELRHVIFALRPVELEKQGLIPALRRYVREWGERTGIKPHVAVVGELVELPLATQMTLFRLAQESLNNVRKHAAAQQVWITLDMSPATAVGLTVRDDGRGFDSPPFSAIIVFEPSQGLKNLLNG